MYINLRLCAFRSFKKGAVQQLVRIRFYSHHTGSGNGAKCPFLSKSTAKSISKPSTASTAISHSVCPVMNKTKVISPNRQIHVHHKKSFSAESDITNHPLYPQRDGVNESEFDGGIQWREEGKPDYSLANATYVQQRKGKWTDPNSLESVVSNLVKTLEMELTSKLNPDQWVAMASDVFRYRANDGPWVETAEAVEKGSYNILLNQADPKLYDTSLSFEESHQAFFNAFTKGFIWELLKVYSGPPKVAFTWRHWGKFDGVYNKNKGDGQMIEVYGFGTANVRMPSDQDPRIRIEEFEVFYDMNKFLAELNGTEYTSIEDAGFGLVVNI